MPQLVLCRLFQIKPIVIPNSNNKAVTGLCDPFMSEMKQMVMFSVILPHTNYYSPITAAVENTVINKRTYNVKHRA